MVALTLASATAGTYRTGGTSNDFPHLFYVPVVLSAFLNGLPRGVMGGIVACMPCGPWMPHDVQLGIPQTVENWAIRLLISPRAEVLQTVVA